MSDTITFVGHGNGHGDGMSQWGAFGYASNYAWSWHQILAHYYGGTTESAVDPATSISVRLTALDDQPFTAVVNPKRNLATSVDALVGRYGTVVAVKTGSTTYKVYGRPDAVCPTNATTSLLDQPGSGWTALAGSVSSSTATGAGSTRVEVSVPGLDPATVDRSSLAGLCAPAGSVRSYRGSIVVVSGTEGEARTVNRLPIDQYVRGVVPRESPPSWGGAGNAAGMNALRAQAVAARTYALAEHRKTYAQTCDTDACQVYGGAANRLGGPTDTLTTAEDPRSDSAVTDTAGVVLRDGAGAMAYTQFNASSGGWTSGANFPAVEDLGDAVIGNSWHTWTKTITRAAIEHAYPTIGTLTAIDITKRDGRGDWGGRVQTIALSGTGGQSTTTGAVFAVRLGLASAWFSTGARSSTVVPANPPPAETFGCAGPPTAATVAISGLEAFHRLSPRRLIDTRVPVNGKASPVAAGCVLVVEPGALAELPAGASTVSLNVTVADPAAPGYATAYPCDQGVPLASTVNYRTGQTVANQATVPLDASGRVCVFVFQKTNLVIDLLGWFATPTSTDPSLVSSADVPAGELFTSLAPTRLADTRSGLGGTKGQLGALGILPVTVSAALPAGAKPNAVVLNITATNAAAAGYLTAYACDSDRPLASNLNPAPGQDVAAHVVAPLGADGKVCIFTHDPTDVVVDIMGWYGGKAPNAVGFEHVAPSRLLDTRNSEGPVVAHAPARVLHVLGAGRVPTTGVTAVVVNLTATNATGAGFATVYACDDPLPTSSNLNFDHGLDVANLATVPVRAAGAICLYTNRTADLIVDIAGWFGTA